MKERAPGESVGMVQDHSTTSSNYQEVSLEERLWDLEPCWLQHPV